ncbi:YbfB/YjiJ family MFS transporter [Dactylosporangium sp. NPDC005572]|uniref:YbfB/YjiJ family MFS transporter n=1 Tax=Dactylosporangium sp. NPDC005572 TaxID=3156889 RepID=UPI0033AFE300
MWWRSLGLAAGTACALGFARFAYGLFVPAMAADLHWTLARAGTLTTANSAGYLLGALLATALTGRVPATTGFRAGMVLTVASLAATAAGPPYPALLAARAVGGLGGAWAFIAGAALARRLGGTLPMTVYFGGAGAGTAVAGGVLPALLDGHPSRWTLGWWLLTLAAVAALAVSWPSAAVPDGPDDPRPGSGRPPLAIAYLLFGAGYIGYVTFLSAYLDAHRAGVAVTSAAWVTIGLSAVAAPLCWHRPIATWPGTRALRCLLALVAVAAALPLLSPAAVVASALLFGGTFMMVPAAVTALAGGARRLAALTVVFAAGQAVGPWLAGALADRAGPAAIPACAAVLCAAAAATTRSSARSAPTAAPPPRGPAPGRSAGRAGS